LNVPSAPFSIRISGFSMTSSVISTCRFGSGSSCTPTRTFSAEARSVSRLRSRTPERSIPPDMAIRSPERSTRIPPSPVPPKSFIVMGRIS